MQTDPRAQAQRPDVEPDKIDAADDRSGPGEEPAVTEELLVEEISIDGMCGVY